MCKHFRINSQLQANARKRAGKGRHVHLSVEKELFQEVFIEYSKQIEKFNDNNIMHDAYSCLNR
jgi:hypothetical protein